jgi:hypothetical protein
MESLFFDMNVVIYVKKTIQLITYLASGGTLLTVMLLKFAFLRNPTMIHWMKGIALTKWHYWAGWLTVVGFVFSRGTIMFVGKNHIAPLKPEQFIHAVLSICCARFVFAKIRRISRSGISYKFVWDIRFLVFGATFVITTFMVIILRITKLEMLMVQQNLELFRIMLLGHIGTAVILIWFGYLLLSSEEYDIKIDSGYWFEAKG